MRIALISDIHGNLAALEAVLSTLAVDPPDQLICLGDVAAFGPQPHETIARLRATGCPVVMGNTDAWLLDPRPHPIRNENSTKFMEIEMWCAAQLTEADRATIRTYQPTITVPLEAQQQLLCFHGTPRSNKELLRATTPNEEVAQMLDGRSATLFAGGHTHTPLLRRWHELLIINPGSVGRPFFITQDGQERHPHHAEYALIHVAHGCVQVTLHQLAYDVRAVETAVRATDMPHQDWWLRTWTFS